MDRTEFFDIKLFHDSCMAKGIEITEDKLKKFNEYSRLLLQWNEKINLTKITEPKDISIKHFLDSILPLSFITIPQGSNIVDVGSGAGFPIIPIGIMRDDLSVTMIDSLNKRVQFLNLMCENLKINGRAIHMRAEEAGSARAKVNFREKFDFVFARAVAPLNLLAEYCIPLLKVDGYFIALKGYDCDEEIKNAKTAIKILGAKIERTEKFELNESNKRSIVIIKKISQTSTNYPRSNKEIAKKPL